MNPFSTFDFLPTLIFRRGVEFLKHGMQCVCKSCDDHSWSPAFFLFCLFFFFLSFFPLCSFPLPLLCAAFAGRGIGCVHGWQPGARPRKGLAREGEGESERKKTNSCTSSEFGSQPRRASIVVRHCCTRSVRGGWEREEGSFFFRIFFFFPFFFFFFFFFSPFISFSLPLVVSLGLRVQVNRPVQWAA